MPKNHAANIRRRLNKIDATFATLAEIYGPNWWMVKNKRSLGRKFKAAVKSGQFPKVSFSKTKSCKHALYEIK